MKKKAKQMKVMGWGPGARGKVKPEVAAAELARIRAKYGRLVSEDVVKEARNPKNPMHPAFEWDNSVAAHQWRLHQARDLICRLRILPSPHAKERVRYLLHGGPEIGYATVGEIRQVPGLMKSILAQAKADLRAWVDRFEEIKAVSRVRLLTAEAKRLQSASKKRRAS